MAKTKDAPGTSPTRSEHSASSLGYKARAAAAYSDDFFARLCAAARLDGRALDPLFCDFCDLEEEKYVEKTIGSACYTTQLVLTESAEQDRKLHRLFRSAFPNLDVQTVSETSFEGDNNNEAWKSLLLETKIEIDNAKVATLLRKDFLDMFWLSKNNQTSPDFLVVPRYQFLFIEACRIREGLYNRSFRRILEVFDLKTQADRLETAWMDPTSQEEALDALHLLRIQWPTPSNSALKTTHVVTLLQVGIKTASVEGVRTGCLNLLEYWKSLKNLEEISSVLKCSGDEDNERLQPSLQKAGQALIITDNPSDGTEEATNCTPEAQTASINIFSMEDLTFSTAQHDPKETTEVFRYHGIVMLLDMVTSSLDECAMQAADAFDALREEHLEPLGLNVDGDDRFDLPMAKSGKARRVDNQYKILDDPNSPIAKLGRHLQQEIPFLLCNSQEKNFRLEQAGVIHCLPKRANEDTGTPLEAETWHCEGSTLFSDAHHDAHCLNVYIPLTDIKDANGTMEFVPGTHVDAFYHQVAPGIADLAEQDASAQHDLAVRANTAAGSTLVLDSRLYYRGLPNNSNEERRFLYFTFAKSWFRRQEEGRQQAFKRELDVHSKMLIVSRLHQLVAGLQFPQFVSISEPVGHPFYTNRFDLLLLDGLLSEDKHARATAMANIAAIVHFCKLSEGDKETMARQFVYSLSATASERRGRVLRKARGKRQKHHEAKADDIDSVTILPNTADAAALLDLTATIIMEESTLVSKLGFTSDENGIAVLLAMLKAHAHRQSLGCIGITESRLEECFTSWWHARGGRFSFFPANAKATSDDDEPPSSLLVIFSGLDSENQIRDWSTAITGATAENTFDILHVIDPSFSCFCQDPDGQWKGSAYYLSELEDCLSSYESILFFGDSVGASAALRFSRLATKVLALSPHIDIPTCKTITRTDFPPSLKTKFRSKLMEEVKASEASISVHYAEQCREQCDQVKLLPPGSGIELIGHRCSQPDLFSHLVSTGAMIGIIKGAISECTLPKTPRRMNKVFPAKLGLVPEGPGSATSSQ